MRIYILVLVGCILPSIAAATEPSRPNIIWIVADDLGYNDLSCMGQQDFETPRIDAMARGGMTFTQFYAGCTVCAPSRACFLTGQHTGHVYQRFNGQVEFREDPQDYTVASMLKSVGYKTAMIGKSGLSCNSRDTALPNRKGFDHFFGFVSHFNAHRYHPRRLIRNGAYVDYPGNSGQEGNVYSGDEFLRESLQWIDDNKESNFFLHLSLQQPHADLQVPESYRKKFIGNFDETAFPGGHYRAEANPKATVAAMITYLDESVGKIVAEIKRLGLSENTLILFTSDNGPHAEGGHSPEALDSNGPLRGGKRDLYEGGIRVPLIAYWPGTVKAGTTSDLISAFWDFPATACELAGAEEPPNSDGISVAPTLTGKGQQRFHESLYWEFYEQGGKQAVRAGDWKAIRLQVGRNRSGPVELYNLKSDISETTDVADSYPDVVKKMVSIMETEHVASPIARFKPDLSARVAKAAGRRIRKGKTLKRKRWKAIGVDSQSEFNGKRVQNIFDNKANTFWHTEWKSSSPEHPHYFVLDLGKREWISGVRILNRQDESANGYIKDFAIYISNDRQFKDPVFTSSLKPTRNEQSVNFPATKGRFVKFVSLNAFEDQPYASIAEFNLETR